MKTIVPLILLLVFMGCSKKDDTAAIPPPVQTPTCPKITSFTVNQQADLLIFDILNTNTSLFYEISYSPASAGNNDPNNGQKFNFNTLTVTKDISILNIQGGSTYLFYARTTCTDGTKSEWSAAVSKQITFFCNKPTNLRFELDSLTSKKFAWDSTSGASYYQIQYGPQNFTLGTGTTSQVNSTFYNGMIMAANTTYDFYVRSFCSNSIGWSSWSGPYTYLSIYNQNLCATPLNLKHTVETVGSTNTFFSLQWNANGETNFEITIVGNGQAPSTGTISTFNYTGASSPVFSRPKYYTYNVYIRAVCSNGTKTAWAGPRVIAL